MCTYHGWTYDLQGKLVGVPGFKDYYHEDLDREAWGLVSAAGVDSYKGFVFATLDEETPPLLEYLGAVGRMSLDMLAEHGDIRIVGGVQKYTIGCNWKFAADNVWDYYHGQISHASAFMVGNTWRRSIKQDVTPTGQLNRLGVGHHRVILGEFGHAISGPALMDAGDRAGRALLGQEDEWRDKPGAQAALGRVGLPASGHLHIFPNMWITQGNQVSMRMPKGPMTTEIWWFTLIDKDLPPEQRENQVHRANHGFGPAGMAEQEDGENWDQSTRGTSGTVARHYPLHYAMNLGRGEVIEDETGPPYIDTHVNEHAQLWLYRAWSEWMAAEGWQDLRQNHSAVPRDRV
jgi:phenylpropionate dioxygenase-like ring-hydroxylating dioxygenase large terminal subunit